MNYEEFKNLTGIDFNEQSPAVFYLSNWYIISRIEENYLEVFNPEILLDNFLKITYQELYDEWKSIYTWSFWKE